MAVETVEALQIPDDSQKAEALNHFYRNGGPKQVCNFWQKASPMILEKLKQASSTQEPALTEHELLTLAGGSFEGLALSWLKTQEGSGGFKLVEIKFKKLLELLSETKKISIEETSNPNFVGTAFKWQGSPIIVPDGFIVKLNPQAKSGAVIGIVECHFRRRRIPTTEKTRLFLEFLRENPETLQGYFQESFPDLVLTISQDPDFRLITRKDIPNSSLENAAKKGWNPQRTPFNFFDVIAVTLDLLSKSGRQTPLSFKLPQL